MKFIIDNWTLILLALTAGLLLLWPTLKGGMGGASSVSTDAAVHLINREKGVLIDICEPQEYATGHVSGAKHIPLDQLASRLPAVVKNKDVPVIFVCQSGMRSSGAVRQAKGMGYTRAVSLNGGLSSWRSANLPIEKG